MVVNDTARLPLWCCRVRFPFSPVSRHLPAPPQPVSILGQKSVGLPWRWNRPPAQPAVTFAVARGARGRRRSTNPDRQAVFMVTPSGRDVLKWVWQARLALGLLVSCLVCLVHVSFWGWSQSLIEKPINSTMSDTLKLQQTYGGWAASGNNLHLCRLYKVKGHLHKYSPTWFFIGW